MAQLIASKPIKKKKGFAPLDPALFKPAAGLYFSSRKTKPSKASDGKPKKGIKKGKRGAKKKKPPFSGVDLKATPDFLASDDASFFGHKEIIFAGFCAWLLRSKNRLSSKHAIAIATAHAISDAEKGSKIGRHAVPGLAHFNPQFMPLFMRVYRFIGGQSAMIDAYNAAEIAYAGRILKQRSVSIDTQAATLHSLATITPSQKAAINYVVRIADVLQYHAINLAENPKFGPPHFERTVGCLTAVSKLTGSSSIGGHFEKTQAYEHWRMHKRAIAYLHAASTVKLNDGRTVLDALMGGKLKFEDVRSVVGDWFGCAKYFDEMTIKKMAHLKPSTKNSAIPISKKHQQFSPEIIRIFEEKLIYTKKQSEKRLQLKTV